MKSSDAIAQIKKIHGAARKVRCRLCSLPAAHRRVIMDILAAKRADTEAFSLQSVVDWLKREGIIATSLCCVSRHYHNICPTWHHAQAQAKGK